MSRREEERPQLFPTTEHKGKWCKTISNDGNDGISLFSSYHHFFLSKTLVLNSLSFSHRKWWPIFFRKIMKWSYNIPLQYFMSFQFMACVLKCKCSLKGKRKNVYAHPSSRMQGPERSFWCSPISFASFPVEVKENEKLPQVTHTVVLHHTSRKWEARQVWWGGWSKTVTIIHAIGGRIENEMMGKNDRQ